MVEVVRTEAFERTFRAIRDDRARSRILVRIQRLEDGNTGDAAAIGEGVSELRIHYGPGYRVYYAKRGDRVILLLLCGDKASQAKDIVRARALNRDIEL